MDHLQTFFTEDEAMDYAIWFEDMNGVSTHVERCIFSGTFLVFGHRN